MTRSTPVEMTDAELLAGATEFVFSFDGKPVRISHQMFSNRPAVKGWLVVIDKWYGLVSPDDPIPNWESGRPESGWIYKGATEFKTVRAAIAAIRAQGVRVVDSGPEA